MTSIGIGVPAFTDALKNVTQSLRELKGVPTPRGKNHLGLIDDTRFNGPDRAYRMAKEAVTQALAQASPAFERRDAALILSTLTADSRALEELYEAFITEDTPSLDILEALRLYPNAALLHALGNEFGLSGPRMIVSNACASGNLSMGMVLDMMRLGQCRSAVVVGAELVKLSVLWGAERAAFIGRSLRPFHAKREGSVLGEGAGALVFESSETVDPLRVLGWLEGFGCGVDKGAAGNSLTEDGAGLRRAMGMAVNSAGRETGEIEYINAHAPGTRPIDRIECQAITDTFGEHAATLAINSTKGLTSHMSAASGVVEAASVLIQMNEGFVHGNVGLDEPDAALACPVMGQQTIRKAFTKALSNGCGGGGLNTSVLLTHPAQAEAPEVAQTVVEGPFAITGMGTVSHLGAGTVALFAGDVQPLWVGGRLPWFDVEQWFPPETHFRYMSRSAQLAACSGKFAIEDANFHRSYASDQVAVLSGTLFGGSPEHAALLCGTLLENPARLLPSMALDHGIHLGSSLIRRFYDYNGITYSITGSPVSGLNALKVAINLLTLGRAQAAIVVAHDSVDAPLEKAVRWFPEAAEAQKLSEGAGTLVIETLAAALARGASPWCTIEQQLLFSTSLRTEDLRQQAADRILASFPLRGWETIYLAGTAIDDLLGVSGILSERLDRAVEIRCVQKRVGYCMSADGALALCAAAAGGEKALVLAAETGGSVTAISLLPGSRDGEYLPRDSKFFESIRVTERSLEAPSWACLYQALQRASAEAARAEQKKRICRELVAQAGTTPFPWRMKNGSVLFISPLEGSVSFQTVGWDCFRDGTWEPEVERCLRWLLKPDSVCIDVGANLGYLTAVMAQCSPGGRVYAFEPMASTFERLTRCIRSNAFANVTAFPLALGSCDETATLFVHEAATGNASLHKDPIARSARAQSVATRSLDQMWGEGKIRLPHVIKIDVEGHELEILKGASGLIRASGAHLLFEFNERMSRLAGWNAQELARTLASLGDFDTFQVSEAGLVSVELGTMDVTRNTHIDLLSWNRKQGPCAPSPLLAARVAVVPGSV